MCRKIQSVNNIEWRRGGSKAYTIWRADIFPPFNSLERNKLGPDPTRTQKEKKKLQRRTNEIAKARSRVIYREYFTPCSLYMNLPSKFQHFSARLNWIAINSIVLQFHSRFFL